MTWDCQDRSIWSWTWRRTWTEHQRLPPLRDSAREDKKSRWWEELPVWFLSPLPPPLRSPYLSAGMLWTPALLTPHPPLPLSSLLVPADHHFHLNHRHKQVKHQLNITTQRCADSDLFSSVAPDFQFVKRPGTHSPL